MTIHNLHAKPADRRKQIRLQVRKDLDIIEQKYEGRTCHVVKDPVSMKYYRFNDHEYYIFQQLDGKQTLEEVQKSFELKFRPHRLPLEDLEAFARQLVTAGLVIHEHDYAASYVYERRRKQRLTQKLATYSNFLYIKIPLFDPDRILTWMLKYTGWIFTRWFLAASMLLWFAAIMLVATRFDQFYANLPSYQEFFRFHTILYMWIALGIVKVIHEFGHGLSCKAFGGECHEMGALLMCLSPALYCNVTDSWTVADKWKRIIISFAGIYVELCMAAIATFVWWNTTVPFIKNISLAIMVLCSVSTVLFNANPLMRFDGYYILADWLEIPNLRERANRMLSKLVQEKCLGIEVQPEPYMALHRKLLFIGYAIASYIYRWVVTFSILYFLSNFLKPYKLGSVSLLMAIAAVGTMIFWPTYRLVRGIQQRGRLPDMKRARVLVSLSVLAALIGAFFIVPLPISRIYTKGVVQVDPDALSKVVLPAPAVLKALYVQDGQMVEEGQVLARLSSRELNDRLIELTAQLEGAEQQAQALRSLLARLPRAISESTRQELEQELKQAQADAFLYATQKQHIEKQVSQLRDLRAPRAGIVMSPPRPQDAYKFYDLDQTTPFCSIGDPKRLRVLIAVAPADYRLLKEDLAHAGRQGRGRQLPVSVHLPGRSDVIFHGLIKTLPESDARDVPIQLTNRAGGPLPVRPSDNPNVLIPQSQQYLVPIELLDADHTIRPGVLAQVKVHCEWRTGAWWVWRAVSSALDLGLI